MTQSEFGGAQHFIYRLVTNLDLNKYDILIAAGPEGNDANGLLFTLKKNGFKTHCLKFLRRGINPLFDFKLGLIEIYILIKKIKPDILFLCSSKAGAMGSLVGRLAKAPKIIYRLGGWTFNDPHPYLLKFYYKFIEKTSAPWKDIIINNAESDKQQAMKLGIKPRKEILVIHNGVDIDELKFFPREEARKRLNLGQSDFIAGTVANFYPAKGLSYLIEAINLIRDSGAKFVLIGDGNERKRIKDLIHKYKLEKKVVLAGAVPESYKYLKAFDVFVLPSIKEGFPWTILEAMAAEVAVIATSVGAIPEVIEANKNGILIELKNPHAIADSIMKLLKDENFRNRIAIEGKKTVVEKFNLKKMVKKYEDLFSIN